MPREALTVGEVAKRTGLSVRTLHHYDALGLLEPSGRTDAGYRLYTVKDLMKLQQIVLLGISRAVATIYKEEPAVRQKTGIDAAMMEYISRAGAFNPVE
jgi:hypothetical protein